MNLTPSLRWTVPLVAVVFASALAPGARADERIRSPAELRREGYREVRERPAPGQRATRLAYGPHSLPWPVRFEDDRHPIGNAMAEFQPFGSPYYHGGCDLRVRAGERIHTPVAGRLEAGHYSYSNNADGSLTKFFKPWPQSGDSTYFEVAVVDDQGIRFEFHHVNRSTLPADIVKKLDSGPGARVDAGTLLGEAIRWPDGAYHHTHYNVITPQGTRINPEYLSPLLEDASAPEIRGVYAVMKDGSVQAVGQGPLTESPFELVVATSDHQGDGTYEHPPVQVSLRFAGVTVAGWDFSRILGRPDGSFVPLFDFFKKSIRTPEGKNLETSGGYGTGLSLVRLPFPTGVKGDFEVVAADIAGNATTRPGRL